MARLTNPLALALIGVLTASCSQDLDANEGGRDMSAALVDASKENERHADACAAAVSLSEMMDELTVHDAKATDLMQRMGDASGRMRGGAMMGTGHCSGSRFDHMSRSLDGFHSNMAKHDERMRAAQTLGSGQSECAIHADSMRKMLGDMLGDLASMPCMGM